MTYHKRENDPIAYLHNVLISWQGFCETHKGITKAIQSVLDENEKLRNEIKELKKLKNKEGTEHG